MEYIDPYSGEPDSYMVNQEINRKKHPIGSEYKLLYSREKRTAYEKRFAFSDWLPITNKYIVNHAGPMLI